MRKGWRRRVARILEAVGALDGGRLAAAQTWFDAQQQEEPTLARTHFMLLRLVDPSHRVGQPDRLNQARLLLPCGHCMLREHAEAVDTMGVQSAFVAGAWVDWQDSNTTGLGAASLTVLANQGG